MKAEASVSTMRLAWLFIPVLAIVVYWRSLYGFAIWDDHQIIEYQHVGGDSLWKTLTGHFLIYYRPFTGASYYLDTALFGRVAIYYHATNVAIHALGSLAVAWAAKTIFRNDLAGIFAGVFFALQPAQVAATAWIGGRTDDLSCLFLAIFLGSLLTSLNLRAFFSKRSSRDDVPPSPSPKPGRPNLSNTHYWVSVLAFFCAVMTKEQNLPFIFLVPLAVYGLRGNWTEAPNAPIDWPRSSKATRRIALLLTVPYALAALVFLALLATFKSNAGNVVGIPLWLEISRIGGSALHYGLLFLIPDSFGLTALSLGRYSSPIPILAGFTFLAAFSAGVVWAYRRNRAVALAMIGLLLGYLPVSNVVPIPSLIVAPYRVAVPGLFVACLLGYALAWGVQKRSPIVAALTAANLLLGAYWTVIGIGYWSDEATFYKTVAANDPWSILAKQLNATQRLSAQDAVGALDWADRALDQMFGGNSWLDMEHVPDEVEPGSYAANLIRENDGTRTDPGAFLRTLLLIRASALHTLGRFPEELACLRAAEKLDPTGPEVNNALGKALLKIDRAEALRHLEVAVRRSPDQWGYLNDLAHERYADKQYRDAADLFRRATKLAPWFGGLWISLSDCLDKTGDTRGALSALDSAEKGMVMDQSAIDLRRKRLQAKMNRNSP